ncbi:MAG: type I glyceraldehyde-3-phosphate dehydrogenase [Candidatus Woesebacteria bacterium]|jgi:glyceraldehyde 3-phosphate dehydrogenase
MVKIALNGYGRIGRAFHRIAINRGMNNIIAINSRSSAQSHAHLLKYDTVYKRVKNGKVRVVNDNEIDVNGQRIKVFVDKDPGEIDWKGLGVDIVVEATGKFKDEQSCRAQIEAGAKKVVISAPGKGEMLSVIMGVNDADYKADKHHVISNASCTTNALALVIKVLQEEFGITRAYLTTIHAITNSQNLLDASHKKNLRLARAAFANLIPSSTGASRAIINFFPELEGRIDAVSMRVPLPTVSLIDLSVNLKKKAKADRVNEAFKKYSKGSLSKYLGFTDEALVSSDFIGEEKTAVVDSQLTKVIDTRLVKVFAWYDNEWGYTQRLTDLVEMVSKKL